MENTSVLSNTTALPISLQGVVITLFVNTIIQIIGVLSNGITLLVIFQKEKWDSTDTLIFSLTATEFAAVLMSAVHGICNFYLYMVYTEEKSGIFHRLILKEIVICGAAYFFVMSRFVLAIIAAQRCTALKSALWYARIWKTSTTKIFIFIAAIFSFADTTTRILHFLNEGLKFDTSTGMYRFVSTSNISLRITMSIVSIIFLAVPSVVTWTLHFSTIVMILKRAKQNRDKSTMSEQRYERELRIARTVLLVSMMNLICTLPTAIVLRVFGLDRFDPTHIVHAGRRELGNTIFDVVSLLPSLNMAVNCVFFVWRSPKYKGIFISILPCRSPSGINATRYIPSTEMAIVTPQRF